MKIKNKICSKNWKILIADDDREIHTVTKVVLSNYKFKDRGFTFLSAYSASETKKIIAGNPDIAILFLDVVMEKEDSGLEIVRWIREDLGNRFIRIILRTGQPGWAPEKKIVTEYDINDYKEKTELTAQKLFTTVTSSMRSYNDLHVIERNSRGLEKIIKSSAKIFEIQSIVGFTSSVLAQFAALFSFNGENRNISGLAITKEKETFRIISGNGRFSDSEGKIVSDVLTGDEYSLLLLSSSEKTIISRGNIFIGRFPSRNGRENFIFLISDIPFSEIDKNLIRLFSTNIGVGFDNIYLNMEIEETQKEVIFTLGDVVESRSHETGNHVKRVAAYSHLLSIKAGLDRETSELVRLASPMHDIGKIGIADTILNKPEELSSAEFDIMKKHTTIGFQILRRSERETMKTAATIALQHHEQWNGKGYPNHLSGTDIHIFGRITSLADVFDGLAHKRSYKPAWETGRIIDFLKKEREKRFDPELLDLFITSIDEIIDIKDQNPD